jgi:hypothetical protein
VNRTLSSIVVSVTLLCGAGALVACGSDEGSAPTTAAPAGTTATSTGAAAQTSATADPAATDAPPTVPATVGEAAPGVESFDICATVPALDVISAVLTEPATEVTDLERGPGEEKCEATTAGGVDTVQFGRLVPADRAQIEETAAQLGYPVSDLDDPTLPGAYTYAGVVAVIVDGTEWSVQVITFDTITDPTSPVAVERSAALLRAWLPLLGVG